MPLCIRIAPALIRGARQVANSLKLSIVAVTALESIVRKEKIMTREEDSYVGYDRPAARPKGLDLLLQVALLKYLV